MENSNDNDSRSWTRVKVLGSGAFGVVELWRKKKTGENIAIKKCQLPVESMSPRQVQRWHDEVEFMKKIQHPNIVASKPLPDEIIDENSPLPILCMEYCKRGDLRQLLSRSENCYGIEEKEALKIMKSIASAVEYLHTLGITHRDLKPENIVLQEGRHGTIYKLMDLGFAKELGNESIAASVVGTLSYLAPELLWKPTYSCSVDYWSLGILFYEIIKGSRPFFPNMPINKTWMAYLKKKQDHHISIRRLDCEVVYSTTIKDPSNMCQYLRDEFVPWFRSVLRFDSSKRGKEIENGEPTIVVFRDLQAIFEKQTINMFFVSKYKRVTYGVSDLTTIRDVQRMIFAKEGIPTEDQYLVTWSGRVLEDFENGILQSLDNEVLIIYERGRLLIDDTKAQNFPDDLHRMLRPIKKYNPLTLRFYYSAAVFFMRRELELLNHYIIALSIKIDMCEAECHSISVGVNKLIDESSVLLCEMQPEHSDDKSNDIIKKFPKVNEMREKVLNIFTHAQAISEALNDILTAKEQLKEKFSKISSEGLSSLFGAAVEELETAMLIDERETKNPKPMLKIYFDFLKARQEILDSDNVVHVAQGFIDVEIELFKITASFSSFNALLSHYKKEWLDMMGTDSVERIFFNFPGDATSADHLIRSNIVLGHMTDALLVSLEKIKDDMAALNCDFHLEDDS